MKGLFPVMMLAVLTLAGCRAAQQEVSVKDVTKSETILLQKKPGQGSISGISITGHGSIVGRAEVQLILNGAVYKKVEVQGDVSFTWGGDWYADRAEVRYISGTASSGSLTLRYDFRAL